MFAMASPIAAADHGLTTQAHSKLENQSILAPVLYWFEQLLNMRQYSPANFKVTP